MVAPIDAKRTFEVEGEKITLRLNFRSLALARKEGVDLMAGKALDAFEIAIAMRCLAVQDHPEMTDDEAFAIVVRGGEASAGALADLFTEFGGKASAGGNVRKNRKAPIISAS